MQAGHVQPVLKCHVLYPLCNYIYKLLKYHLQAKYHGHHVARGWVKHLQRSGKKGSKMKF